MVDAEGFGAGFGAATVRCWDACIADSTLDLVLQHRLLCPVAYSLENRASEDKYILLMLCQI